MTTPPTTLTITLPLPPRILHPNHTVGSFRGRMAKSSKVRAARQTACIDAMAAMGEHRPLRWARATCAVRWHFSTNRRRDKDNLLGWLKPYFDGFTDAGVWLDDSAVTHLPHVIVCHSELAAQAPSMLFMQRVEIEIRKEGD